MTTPRALTFSIAGNFALVAAIGVLLVREAPPPAAVPEEQAISGAQHDPSAASAASSSGHPRTNSVTPLGWSDSLSALRRAGVPSAIIARVVVEHVAQKWTPLEAEHERQYSSGEIDARRLAELRDQRAQEEERELRAALGDGFVAWEREHLVATMYLGGHVPAENEKDALYRLQKDWLRQLRELESAQREGRLSESAFDATRARAEQEFKWNLAALIGVDRVDGLAADPDPLQQVKQDFRALNLSDTQITALATAHQEWNDGRRGLADHLAETKTVDHAYDGDLRALDLARDEKFRRILGEETFLLWQRAGDDRYRVLRTNAQRWNLDRTQVDQVYAAIRSYDLTMATLQHQAAVRSQTGEAFDRSIVNHSLDCYTAETAASLRRYLGDERFAALAQEQLFNLRSATTEPRDHGAKPPGK